jgi:hypothetical protein
LPCSRGEARRGLAELVQSLIFREPPLTVEEIAGKTCLDAAALMPILEQLEREGPSSARSATESALSGHPLLVPLGATAGWEAAVFDHFGPWSTTVICRLREESSAPGLRTGRREHLHRHRLPGHPLAEEVYATLGRLRAELGSLRARVAEANRGREVPESHTRVVMYLGQCLIDEGNEPTVPHE